MFNLFRKKYYVGEVNTSQDKKLLSRKDKRNLSIKASKGIVEEADTFAVSSLGYLPRTYKRKLTPYDMWIYYLTDSWIRACVDKIVREVVKYSLVAAPKNEGEEVSEETKQHVKAVQELLDNPNEKIESFDDIRRKYLRDILIYDAGAVEIVKGEESKQPRELYDLCGPDIVLNVDAHGNFLKEDKDGVIPPAYRLKLTSKNKSGWPKFAKDEVIYMIQYPQAGSIYGLSPIETLYVEIENDIEAAKFNEKILKHSGMLSGVLSFPGLSTANLKKRIKSWEEGVKRKGQQMIVTNNPNVKFTALSASQKDMQFFEYQKWLLNKIMAVYGMQPIVLGVVDATTGKLNSKEQREQFKQDAVIPLLKLEAHRFTDVLVNQTFRFKDVELIHEDPKVEIDEEFQLKKVETLGNLGVIKIDEARAMLGLDPLNDGSGDKLITTETIKKIKEVVEKADDKDNISAIRQRIQELLDVEATTE